MNNVDYLKLKFAHLEISDREKLIKEIKEFIQYSLRNTSKIDNELVYELLELLIDCRDLKDFVKEVLSFNLSSDLNLGHGSFYPNSLTIEIYLYNIIHEYKEKYKNHNPYIQKLLYLFQVLMICFHEVEHANQLKICRENNSSLEVLILRNSMKYLPNKDFEMLLINKGYNAFELSDIIEIKDNLEYDSDKYYVINPSERLAKIKSYFIGICSMANYFEECPKLKYELFYYLIDTLYDGYNKYKNPTEVFIKKYDHINELDLIKTKSERLTFLEKCAFGMKLSNNERKKLKEKRDNIKNKVLLYK